ncbi:maltotransferase domain-containing protein, partial [Bradyrhizobium sp.]
MNKTLRPVESAHGTFHVTDVYPSVDGGRFPVKRIAGEPVEVWADIYRDGHDVISAALVWRREGDDAWQSAPMTPHSDDRWGGAFVPERPGRYTFAIEAWTDQFASWRHRFVQKQRDGSDHTLDALEGAGMLTQAQAGGPAAAAVIIKQCEIFLQTGEPGALLAPELQAAMAGSQFRRDLMRSQPY